MVLQVFPDRQIGHRLDADRAQMIGRADAGQHQQLRRIERAAAQDDLAIGHGIQPLAALLVFDAGRALCPRIVTRATWARTSTSRFFRFIAGRR